MFNFYLTDVKLCFFTVLAYSKLLAPDLSVRKCELGESFLGVIALHACKDDKQRRDQVYLDGVHLLSELVLFASFDIDSDEFFTPCQRLLKIIGKLNSLLILLLEE